MHPAVGKLLDEVAAEISTLPPIAIREFAPVLAQARREAVQGLSRWLQTIKDGDARFTAQAYRNAIAQLDQALETIKQLDPAMLKGLRAAERRSSPMAVRHVQEQLGTFSRMFGATVRPIPLEQARRLAEGSKTLIKKFPNSAARYAGSVGDDIRRELAVGMLKGESIGEMTLRLAKHGGPKGEVALSGILGQPSAVSEYIAEGLFKRYRFWGERVARTEVIAVYNQTADDSIHEAHKLDDKIARMWNAAADKRVCPICRDLDGKIAKIGESFPGGYDRPPAHPYDRCSVVAWRSDWG